MEYEHWINQRAIEEVKECGYSNLDDEWDILGYLEQYRPRWQRSTQPSLTQARPQSRRERHAPPRPTIHWE
jgi:hypothetical protein